MLRMRYILLVLFAPLLLVGYAFPTNYDGGDVPYAQVDPHTAALQSAAWVVGTSLDIAPSEVESAWRQAPVSNQIAVIAAVGQLGARYRYASSDPARGFDCSGLTRYAWAQAGVDLPANSRAQINAVEPAVFPVAGDIVQYPGHVMMYLGIDGYVIHSANRRTGVVLGEIHRRVKFGHPQITT